ncbi:MAG: histone family protein [Candidatus Thorarchaeota archaeon]
MERRIMPRSRKDRIIPVAPIDKLIRKATRAARVSDKGAERLAQILEEVGDYIARRAFEITVHTKRKTITDKDIELAYKQWGRPS